MNLVRTLPGLAVSFWRTISVLKQPDQRNQEHSCHHHEDVERDAEFQIIREAVSAGTVDHEVGLVAHRRGKAGTGAETDADDKGFGVDSYAKAVEMAMGSSSTAVALLLRSWVQMLVRRMIAAEDNELAKNRKKS